MSNVDEIIAGRGLYISTRGLSGAERKRLQLAAQRGDIVCVKRGIYATHDALADTMVDVDLIVPGGIVCLWSAWSIYGLTTQIPNAYYVAVRTHRKVTLPKYPNFQLVYQSSEQLQLGATTMIVGKYNIRIYDVERCVCDAVKHRNKIGIDVMAEILREYLVRPGRNISRLMQYAQQLRVATTIHKYLELWQ